MQQVFNFQDNAAYDREALKGFARSMAELQWLLLVLVIFYFFIPTHPITDSDSLMLAMVSYSAFALVAYVTSMLASDILYAKRRITLLSKTDDLTGLLNMRAFNNILERGIARVTRYAQPFTVIMVDVDGLKSVNDRFGHTAGSRLATLASWRCVYFYCWQPVYPFQHSSDRCIGAPVHR